MPTSNYWLLPKKTGTPAIIEPYLYEGVLMTSFVAPIQHNGHFDGTGGADRLLATIHAQVSTVHFLDTGYAFLVSNTGIIVSAPDKKLIGKMTLSKLADAKKSPRLTEIAAAIHAARRRRASSGGATGLAIAHGDG
jgi:methyl-accepting chemotaxis protein